MDDSMMQIGDENLTLCKDWYDSLAGGQVLSQLDQLCAEYMSEIFGYYALEMGALSGHTRFFEHSRVAFSASIGMNHAVHDVIAAPEQLPIETDNIDLVVASHVLESSTDPHQVLREIDRILVPEGQLILIGFNPWSLMQSGKRLRKRVDFPAMSRVRDWFSLLGFEMLDVQYLGFRPGVQNENLYQQLDWMESLGKLVWPLLGNLYVIHAKKQVIARRPYKKVWEAPILLSGGKVALNRTARRVRKENFSG
ncbi:MAG: hypothetical protein CSB47_01730 [Proteobacteria bacterium]|nr:MAG: hypothetical protein CSB47_01730 [Pseudomonadota bacterium]